MTIKDIFKENDFILIIAANGEKGLRMFLDIRPNVLAANVMMPHMDSFEMVRRVRQTNKQTPVPFLIARSVINDVVEGFESGTSDYLKKPFGMQELIIRIKALVGRASSFAEEKKITTRSEIGSYSFDTLTQTLTHAGLKQEPSHRETEILKQFYENQNQVASTRNVPLDLQGDDSLFNPWSSHILITKLRHKLSADERIHIINVRGIGYKLILN